MNILRKSAILAGMLAFAGVLLAQVPTPPPNRTTAVSYSNSTGNLVAGFNIGPGTTIEVNAALAFGSGVTQTFAPNLSDAGLNVGIVGGDPASFNNGDIWYNASTNSLNTAINGVVVSLNSGGFTNPMTNPGDMIVGGTAGAPLALAKGADGTVLEMVSGVQAWTTPPGGGNVSTSGTIAAGQTPQWDTTSTIIGVANTGTGSYVLASSPTIATPTITGVVAFPSNVEQIFVPGATNAGVNTGAVSADPSSLVNGDLWYNSTSDLLKARVHGSTVSVLTSTTGVTSVTSTTNMVTASPTAGAVVLTVPVPDVHSGSAYAIPATDYLLVFTGTSAQTYSMPSSPATNHVVLVKNASATAGTTLTLTSGANFFTYAAGFTSLILMPGDAASLFFANSTWQVQ